MVAAKRAVDHVEARSLPAAKNAASDPVSAVAVDGAVSHRKCLPIIGDATAEAATLAVAAGYVVANGTVCYRRRRATWQPTAHAAAGTGAVAADDAVRHRHASATTVEDAAAAAEAHGAYATAGAVAAESAVYHCQLGVAAVDAASHAASAVTGKRAADYCQCRSSIVKNAAALLIVPIWRGRVADAAVG